MATISSLGVGSGLDLESMVTKLVDLEKTPLTTLKTQAATINAKISAFGQIKSLTSPLADAASSLNSLTTWNSVSTTSSNTSAVTATAIGGTAPTTFSVSVQKLAKPQDWASDVMSPAGGLVGGGTLTITTGTWTPPDSLNPASFAAGATAGVSITVDPTDKLADVASKINSANAGVTATILTDTTGERLLLRSKETGAASGFDVAVSDSDGNDLDAAGLSRLTVGSSISQYAEDAAATINGIAVTSSSNTFSNVVSGVSLTVAQETTSAATVTVAKNYTGIRSGIESFVKAYNDLNTMLNDATKYDPGTGTAALLQGDSTAVNLQTAMRRMLSSATTGGTYTRLADIGVSQLQGGNLEIDSTKLTAALEANLTDVKNLFKADHGNTDASGVALKFKNFTSGALAATGAFSSKDTSLKSQLAANGKDQTRVNDKVTRFEKALRTRYSSLDAQVASLKALNSYVTQQITTWNNSSKN